MKHNIEYLNPSDLFGYETNSRTHSKSQIKQISSSIKEFGFTNPILIDENNVIIAGHGRLEGAKALRMDEVPCLRLSYLTETQKKAYVIADNKLALNAGWDEDMLKQELSDLSSLSYDLELTGFDEDELKDLLDIKEEEENPYTQKVETPTYEPVGSKPSLDELCDDSHAMGLIEDIKNSSLPEKEKVFLMAAASRHIVFDYGKIANYYAHSEKETQELMENSALVIIDFNKAIENGLVRLTAEIDGLFESEEDEQ